MGNILTILQLGSELFSIYQAAQKDGTAAEVQAAVQALMAEFEKPEVQDALTHAKALFGVK